MKKLQKYFIHFTLRQPAAKAGGTLMKLADNTIFY